MVCKLYILSNAKPCLRCNSTWIWRVFPLIKMSSATFMNEELTVRRERIQCSISIVELFAWIVVRLWIARRRRAIHLIVREKSRVCGYASGSQSSSSPSSTIVARNSMRSIRMWCKLFKRIRYVDRKNPCVIGGTDQWYFIKQQIGMTSDTDVTISYSARCV